MDDINMVSKTSSSFAVVRLLSTMLTGQHLVENVIVGFFPKKIGISLYKKCQARLA